MRFGLGLVFAAVIGASLWAGVKLRREWTLRPSPWSTVGLLGLAVLASAAGLVFALGRGNDGIMVLDAVLAVAWLWRGLYSLERGIAPTPRSGRAAKRGRRR